MTRINTNVSSLTAQNSLQRSNASLQQSLTRLSTGLRINVGKDDPAGLIASEALKSDITSVGKAISNSQRANEMIATADSALGQASSLLNDIRGLVTEAANTGAMSADQLAANQLQVDSSLDAINRISEVTSFQGRRLLDGTLDFNLTTWGGTHPERVTDTQIDQANLGTAGELDVSVVVSKAAKQAELTATAGSGTTKANATVSFSDEDAGTSGVTVTAAGYSTSMNGVVISFVEDADTAADAPTAEFNPTGKTLTVKVSGAADTKIADIITAIQRDTDFTAVKTGTGDYYDASVNIPEGQQAYKDITFADGSVLRMTASSLLPGTDGNVTFDVTEAVGTGGHDLPTVSFAAGELTIVLDSDSDTPLSELVTAINTDGNFTAQILHGDLVTSEYAATGADTVALFVAPTNGVDAVTATTSGGDGSNTLAGDIVFRLTGSRGSQVFSFAAASTLTQIQDAVKAMSDATGVDATESGTDLVFNSTEYGSDGLVEIEIISDAEGSFKTSFGGVFRDTGDDVEGSINGITANGSGSTLSINTAGLAMSITFDADTSTDADTASFTIGGGGAQFQLGPNVTTGQQARIGIQSVYTASLGGSSGRLYELGSGQGADLTQDSATAALIVDEAINKVTGLRGRLGAFQKATLESSIASLTDTQENLTSAQSAIRDADFAAESANLTRAQILVQSGTAVLAIANQNPQNVLSLLR